MLKNISLGIYYPGKSVLHRVQARTKLLIICWMVVFLWIANHRIWHFLPYLTAVIVVILAVRLADVTLRHMLQRMWLLIVLGVLGALPTLFFPDEKQPVPIYTLGPFAMSYGFLRQAILIYGFLAVFYIAIFRLPIPALQELWRKRWHRAIQRLLTLLTLVAVITFWLIYPSPEQATFPIGPAVITREGIWLMMDFVTIFLVLYALSLLVTMTTTPVALVEGISKLLAPLRRLRLPIDDFALMTMIALRFVPTLMEEIEQLIKAQTARGADLSRGSLFERFRSLLSMFVPLIQGALRRAEELATALEARGYESDGRQTYLHETAFGWLDFVVMGTLLVITLASLIP